MNPFDVPFPALAPAYVGVDVHREADGTYTVQVYAGDGPGYRCAADSDRYDSLASYEALDVVGAVLEGMLGV